MRDNGSPSATTSTDRARQVAAAVALIALAGLVVVLVVTAAQSFPVGVLTALALLGAALAVVEGLRRRRGERVALLAVAAVLSVGSVALLLLEGLVVELAAIAGLLVITALAGRRAFEPIASLEPAPRPRHPVVIWNPKSGGGKAVSNDLATEAAARGIEAIELHRGDDIVQLVTDAVARGADALAAAGGDGTQALVATIAAEHDLPFACIPAGTRNHFALDLGVDRDDVVGALDALVDGGERRVDLAEINGRVFVNNVSLGIYASAVQRDEYRDAKLSTLLDTVPQVIGPAAATDSELRWVGPDGATHGSTAVLLVSNNPYRVGTLIGSGTRPRLDRGVLGIVATRERAERSPGTSRLRLCTAWQQPEFTVDCDQPVPVGVDGEALVMQPPLRFAIRPQALRVRIAPQHPGASPSSGMPTGPLDAVGRLVRIAAGRGPSGRAQAQ
ncbi:MAG: diacylglycerol/lipid kinase family protein [Microthrixaceae bacterium]